MTSSVAWVGALAENIIDRVTFDQAAVQVKATLTQVTDGESVL